MSENIVLHAQTRVEQGKGASRRLRKAGLVPAIIYGAGQEPKMVTLDHSKLLRYEQDESFFASVLKVDIDGANKENVIIRDYQRDPVKPKVLHVDLMRINMSEKLHTSVPLHYEGDAVSPAGKEGALLQRFITEVEVICLPADLPEAIVVDMSAIEVGHAVHLFDIKLPENVELAVSAQVEDMNDEECEAMNLAIASMVMPKGKSTSDDVADDATDAEDTSE
ncbi:MAG TPA: 50S ribosomal protein L25/general stress protein Ctc [Thiothrix sp.]|nr:50S ribosomal protein L25/general stress protein Ctc [Thiothrix sp.]